MTTARAQIARSRIRTQRSVGRTIDSLADEIRDAVNATCTTLRDIDGVGDPVAANIGAETGDPTRSRFNAAFAMANGTVPIEASFLTRPTLPPQPRRQPPARQSHPH